MNQVILVGRLVKDIELKETEMQKSACITLAVSRSFKNADGVYETDFIDCVLWNIVAESTAEYCQKGDVIGIKGRVETYTKDDQKITQVIADKVTFLSRKNSEE